MSTPQIQFHFEHGGEFVANLLVDKAPETVRAILDALPIETTVYHSRWSGREVNFPVSIDSSLVRENDTTIVNTGDVIYWKEWEKKTGAAEAVAVYYGAEVTRDHRGYLPVNVFARIPPDQWARIEEVGIRIWQQGAERITVTRVSNGSDLEEE
ncbi:DUF3830 family protein [Candidatus Bipolaricaulota bacterium]|jgi:hypothetical protein|nr:DUF3830 family protein [Candidatus Bipolaricaulota bacterium]